MELLDWVGIVVLLVLTGLLVLAIYVTSNSGDDFAKFITECDKAQGTIVQIAEDLDWYRCEPKGN